MPRADRYDRPTYWDLRHVAKQLARGQMADLKAGRVKSIGRDTIEPACVDARPELESDDREMLIGLTCRFVVELVFAEEKAPR